MAIRMLKSLHCKSRSENQVFQPTPKRFSSLHQNPPSNLPHNQLHSNPLRPPPGTTPTSHSPLLLELPPGHPSRKVVEIIFNASWSPPPSPSSSSSSSYPQANVEMIFKVRNSGRTLLCFEEYRELVKSMVGEDDPGGRCAADGNELMRFQYLGGYVAPVKEVEVCMFSGSGTAHRRGEEGGGGGGGRRAMLVCRVVAGRVFTGRRNYQLKQQLGCCGELDLNWPTGFDSVLGENDELFVHDPRAVLPCFIITYTL